MVGETATLDGCSLATDVDTPAKTEKETDCLEESRADFQAYAAIRAQTDTATATEAASVSAK